MTCKGHIRNGAIVLDEPINLPEGAVVSVEIAKVETVEDNQEMPTLAERPASVIEKAEGLPPHWSENHDVCLRQFGGHDHFIRSLIR